MFDTTMFSVMDTLFPIVFLVILGVFVFILVQNVRTWNRNNHSPRLSVHAKVVAKRQETSFHQHPNAGDATGAHGFSTSTSGIWQAAEVSRMSIFMPLFSTISSTVVSRYPASSATASPGSR